MASGARSSRFTSNSLSTGRQDDNESIYSVKQFSFTNDLLTAPVYRRLTLKMLSYPEVVPVNRKVSPSSATGHLAKRGLRPTIKWKIVKSARTSYLINNEPEVFRRIDSSAAGVVFGPGTVSDLESFPSSRSSKYLPIRATLKREQLTVEEWHTLDLTLLEAVRRGSLFESAASLDDGADINVIPPGSSDTPSQIAIANHADNALVLFLLHYRNANICVRDGEGQTLLHGAISTGKVRAIQTLLVLGLSMTDEDNNGISPFHVAAENFEHIDVPSTLLEHAKMQGASHHEMVKMDPAALHLACLLTPQPWLVPRESISNT